MGSETIRKRARTTRPVKPEAPESVSLPDPLRGAGDDQPPRPARSRRPSRSDDRRIVRVGIAVSIAVHLLLLIISRFVVLFDGSTSDASFAAAPTPPASSSAMEVVSFRPLTDAIEPVQAPAIPSAERPDVVNPLDAVRPDAPVPQAATPAAPSPAVARDRFSEALDALRPRLLDPRLRPGEADALRTDDERAALRVYARINALNDSILAEMERGRRATDWTWTDADGRRWGVSPGKLHLGGLELPLPLTFSPTAEQRERIREWGEIQAQAERGAIGETFDDRVEAIREARDAERENP